MGKISSSMLRGDFPFSYIGFIFTAERIKIRIGLLENHTIILGHSKAHSKFVRFEGKDNMRRVKFLASKCEEFCPKIYLPILLLLTGKMIKYDICAQFGINI